MFQRLIRTYLAKLNLIISDKNQLADFGPSPEVERKVCLFFDTEQM
jgi:hypothetical protein